MPKDFSYFSCYTFDKGHWRDYPGLETDKGAGKEEQIFYMEPTTEEKNGQNQEDRQDTEPNSNKPHKPGKGRYMIVSALAGILVLAAVLAVFMTRNRETGSVIAGMDYHEAVVDNKIYTSYSQHDTRWSSNPLGSSKDTMGSSGCLTSCIAASLTAQGVHSFSPGELNQIFNENKVYNDRGAIVWKELEQALPYARVRLDCGTTSESIDRLLDEKMYPIVKVKRKSGAVHWIMLTGTEKDTLDITAMDPIDGFVHMSDYDNRIYGIRVVTGSGKSLETTGDETEASGKRPKAFMLTIGNLAMRQARAQFSCNFLACAGYQVIDNLGFPTVEEGVEAAMKAGADIVVLCSSDDEYAEYAVPAFKAVGDRAIFIVAGAPECMEDLKAAGIEHFIHVRVNVLDTLKEFNAKLGIK